MRARARRGRRIVLRPRLLRESRQRPAEPRDDERWTPVEVSRVTRDRDRDRAESGAPRPPPSSAPRRATPVLYEERRDAPGAGTRFE